MSCLSKAITMRNLKKISILLFVFILNNACNDENTNQEVGDLNINFTHKVGDETLNLNTQKYAKNAGETFKIDKFKYIISNIVLTDVNGTQFFYPKEDSYFLIDEELAISKNIRLENISANNYASITFGFGIDQSNYPLNGVDNFVPTAEENDMLWSWSAGYVFLKLEGTYSSDHQNDKDFLYHIGSHGQNLDNYREISLNFSQPLTLSSSETSQIDIECDVLKIFNSEFALLLSDKDDIQIDPINAPKIVDNVTKAFEIVLN